MNKRAVLILISGVVVLVVASVISNILDLRQRPVDPILPEIGGQPAPSEARIIDFSKRYDVHCYLFEKEPTVFRSCKVVGFTGPDLSAEKHSDSSSSFSMSGSARRYFDRWLVLELSDGRLAYIPPDAIKYLETAKIP